MGQRGNKLGSTRLIERKGAEGEMYAKWGCLGEEGGREILERKKGEEQRGSERVLILAVDALTSGKWGRQK